MLSSDIILACNGEEHNLTEWADITGISVASIRARWNKSQKTPDALWEPEQIIYGKAKAKLKNPEKVDSFVSNLNDYILRSIADIGVSEIYSEIAPKLKEKLINEFGFTPKLHKVITPEFETRFEGTVHECFDEVLGLVYNNIPVFLVGAAGTGKNELCGQIAKALNLDFYFSNAITQEYKLTGFIDANGVFHPTQFYNAFTKGGVFFLDEIDASIPEVLVILNAAIANGYFDFPKEGRVTAHKNFRVIAAGNTMGTGADSSYTGRYCLDRASLDRFAVVEVNYSRAIELSLCNNNEDLVNFAHAFRAAVDKASITCIFSYRSINRIATLESLITDLSRVLDISLIKGLNKDDINIIYNNINKSGKLSSSNKYLQALSKLIKK